MDEALVEQSRREFRSLMQRVQEGDEDAAWELLDEFGPYIIRVVRCILTDRMRSKNDSTDFAQSVWKSFFANRAAVDRFDHPQALIAYLTHVARNKVIEEFRRLHQTQKHDVDRERSLDGSAKFAALLIESDDLSPSKAAIGNELMSGLPNDYLKVVRMRRSGMSYDAIAEVTGLVEKTIRRILRYVELEE